MGKRKKAKTVEKETALALAVPKLPFTRAADDHGGGGKYTRPPYLETLIPKFVWFIKDFFSTRECQEWIAFLEQGDRLVYTQQRATRYMAHRECHRGAVEHATDAAQQLLERIQKMCPQAMQLLSPSEGQVSACNPNIRFYKYTKGMSFGKHIDESNLIPSLGITKFTMLLYLSECQGGATRFYLARPDSTKQKKNSGPSSVAFDPCAGALLFHLHGDDCLEHEADPVLDGVKYVLRTDLVYTS